MSTTPIENWGVDLADVSYIYPFPGTEVPMAVGAIALWIAWHIWQIRHENAEYAEQVKKHGDDETIRKALSDD